MKKLLLIGLAFSLAGCSSSEENDLYNPYLSGTGHYAGYEWAYRNDVTSCGGNSDSFIEGCEEYLYQDSSSRR